jgi:hypothetical protein
VSGTPGALLSQIVAATQKTILDALAGNPQTTTVTLPNGATIEASFDLATIHNLTIRFI